MLLSWYSPKDDKFDGHKFNSFQLARYLATTNHPDLVKKASKIEHCADNLSFALVSDTDSPEPGAMRLKLCQSFYASDKAQAKKRPIMRFCRIRGCPVCSWRRSHMWIARAFKRVPRMLRDNPGCQLIFLTLTFKSPALADLRLTVNQMQKAWDDMTRPYKITTHKKTGKVLRSQGNSQWYALGYAKTTEITAGDIPGYCHPHFHAMLLMPPKYFDRWHRDYCYMDKLEWAAMWQKYMGLNYLPSVTVNEVRDRKNEGSSSYAGGVLETFKYEVKGSDLLTNSEFAKAYLLQMGGARTLELGGTFRKYFSEAEDENLVADENSDDPIPDDAQKILFSWQRFYSESFENWAYAVA